MIKRSWYDAERMVYVFEEEDGGLVSTTTRSLADETSETTQYYYGKTREEWLALEKERDELRAFIENELENVIKDIKND